jgi:Tol biopolymer transport system component
MADSLIVTDVIHGYAGRLAWSPDGTHLCFDKIPEEDEARHFDLWMMTADGTRRHCLTHGKGPPFTAAHIGQPAWHPSGEWIVYQAQKDASSPAYDAMATPGSGIQNDLYVMPPNASTTYGLYASVPVTGGVLHPHFSADGRKLSWSEYVGAGTSALGHWVLKQASFVVNARGVPSLTTVQTVDPGTHPDWLENHGFDPLNAARLIVSGNCQGEPVLRSNLYTYNSATLELIPRTDNACWEEHAHYSPNGEWIVFMRGLEPDTPLTELETELWIMRRDGSRARQLTFFHTPGHPHFVAERGIVCADSDWHPDGRRLAVFTQDRLSNQGQIRLCALTLEEAR